MIFFLSTNARADVSYEFNLLKPFYTFYAF